MSDRHAASLLDNDLSLFQLEGFSTPQHGHDRRVVSPSQFQRVLGMMQEALQCKTLAYERAMEELMRCRDELVATKRSIAEMSRAELDSGILREEVERLIMAKCTLAKDKAELERETHMLWLERELVFDQLQADPETSNSLCGVVEEKLHEARQAEGLQAQLQEALRSRRRLAEELAALRTHHRKCRALWQRQERMLLRVLQVQSQLSSRGVRAPHMPPLASGMPIKRGSPGTSVKMLSHPFPRLHHHSDLTDTSLPSQGAPVMPSTPPAATPGTLSRIERAFEALEMGTTRPFPRPAAPGPRPIPSPSTYSLLDHGASFATSSSIPTTSLPPAPHRLIFEDDAGLGGSVRGAPAAPAAVQELGRAQQARQEDEQQQGQEASECGSISFTGPANDGREAAPGKSDDAAADTHPAESSVGECAGVASGWAGQQQEEDEEEETECCSSSASAPAAVASSS